MATKNEALTAALAGALGDSAGALFVALGEATLTVHHDSLDTTLRTLRDHPALSFELMADLCGVDYSTWGGQDACRTALRRRLSPAVARAQLAAARARLRAG